MNYFAVFVTDEPNKRGPWNPETRECDPWEPYFMKDNHRASTEGPRLFVERVSAERSANHFRTQRGMTCEVIELRLEVA